MIYWIIIVLLAGVGVYDLWLIRKGKPTITQGYQKKVPLWLRMVIMCVLLGLCWWIFGGPKAFAPALCWVLVGHLNW